MIPHRCPVCNGTGLVSRPPYVAGDQETWVASEAGPYPCRACGGTGLVWEPSTTPQDNTPEIVDWKIVCADPAAREE